MKRFNVKQVLRGNKKTTTSAAEVDQDTLIPASSGESMRQFIEWIKNYSSLTPKNVFEIGANLGQDAEALREGFGLQPKDVWVFEPHPAMHAYINNHYDFNSFDYAVLNRTGQVEINLINTTVNTNSGISSVRTHKDVPEDNFDKYEVPCIRMDEFIKQNKIKSIDFLKLDVEGCNDEVLEGFGDKLKYIKSLHVEAEHVESWEGEKLWDDLRAKLEPHFEMVFFQRYFTQSDSFWIKKEYLRER